MRPIRGGGTRRRRRRIKKKAHLPDAADQLSTFLLSSFCQSTGYELYHYIFWRQLLIKKKYPKLHTTVYMRFLVLSNVQLSNLASGYLNHP